MPDAPRPRRTGGDEPDRVRELARPLQEVMGRLPEVERRVVRLRMGLVDGHPRNLTDTARELGLTVHEAREIEQRAFERIREVVPLQDLQRLLTGGTAERGAERGRGDRRGRPSAGR